MSGLTPAISSLAKPIYLKEHALHAVKEAIITHQLKPNELYFGIGPFIPSRNHQF